MRKLILALLLMLVAVPAYPWGGSMMVVGGGTPEAGASLYCDDLSDADILCEDIASTTLCATGYDSACRNTWTATTTAAAVLDFTVSPPAGLPCTDGGANSIEFRYDGTSNDNRKSVISIAYTPSSSVYMRGWFVAGAQDVSNNGLEVGMYTADVNNPVCQLMIFDNGSSLLPKSRGRNAAGTVVDFVTGTSALSIGTWYEFTIEYTVNSLCQVVITGGETLTRNSDLEDTASAGVTQVGVSSSDAPFLYNVSNLKIDATAIPGACAQ